MGIRKLQRRLNTKGETLVETMAAVLIAVIVLSMLADMIAASVRMNKKSEDSFAAYYAEEAKMASKEDSVLLAEDGSVTMTDGTGVPVTIAGKNSFTVDFYSNGEAHRAPVISYTIKG